MAQIVDQQPFLNQIAVMKRRELRDDRFVRAPGGSPASSSQI
ncbi:hypothetical protein [Sphingomonas sp.]|nr:hypothetical protein [Sphingomonas sp.]